MGLFDKLERRLEQGVNGAFAKAFRSEVQPVEIASAMRRAMDDKASSYGKGQAAVVQNVYSVELSSSDFDYLTEHEDQLRQELIASAEEHAETQRYQPGGPISVELVEDEELETGVFRLRPSIAQRGGFDKLNQRGSRDERESGFDGLNQRARRDQRDEGFDKLNQREPRDQRQQRPWLDVSGDHYPLTGAITVIGRDDDADIVLDDSGTSRKHAEIRTSYDGPHLVVRIRDLGSTNGTYVNGEKVASTHLQDGDRITVGRTSISYSESRRR